MTPEPSLRARLAALWPAKLIGLTVGMTAFFAAYFAVLHHPFYSPFLMPLTPVDRWVRFHSHALPLYLSLWIYVSLAPALMITRRELVAYGIAALGLGATGIGIFLRWPTVVPPAYATWKSDSLFAFLKNTDASGNACPSLHVAFAVFTALVLMRELRGLRVGRLVHAANALWCAGIMYSTLATRQHVFLDVVAGFVLGGIFGAGFFRLLRLTSPAGPPRE